MGSTSNWQVTKQKVAERGKHIFETSQWADCKFIVGQEPHQQILEGHKLFLAMSSPVFEAMFFGNMAEKNDPIPIRDIQPEAFKALLEYIYTDNINLGSFDLACELLYCAKKYMLPFLVEECTKFLGSNVSPNTACRVYELAKLLEEPELMKECLKIICTKTNSVLSEESFEEIKFETLEMVFDQPKLEINSEIALFSAAERWARAECCRKGLDAEDGKSLRSVIGNVWTKIRFLTLTPQQFAEGPAGSSLLTKDEVCAIFMNVSSSKRKCPMPDAFSTNAQRRVKVTVRHNGVIPALPLRNPRSILITESALCFTVDRDVTVIGVQVLTGVVGCRCPEYYNESSFDIQLKDHNGFVLTKKNCPVTQRDRKYVETTFDRPVDIQRNKVYCIRVAFRQARKYSLTPHSPRMTCGPVLFSLGNSLLDLRETLIRSIIFEY